MLASLRSHSQEVLGMVSTAPVLTLQPGTGSWTGAGLVLEDSSNARSITLARYAEEWLTLSVGLRPRTLEGYRSRLDRHVLPRLGQTQLAEIEPDDILRLLRDLKLQGYTDWTRYSIVVVLKVILNHAVRRGVITMSPFARIARHECPAPSAVPRRILNSREISALLDATSDKHRCLVMTAIFSGLRQSELLALQWDNIDAVNKVIRVQTALDRQQRHVPLKTKAGRRDVVVADKLLVALENKHRRSRYSEASDYVFASQAGTPLHWRNASRRIFKPALERAGLPGRVRWHDLRHTYASILIAGGANVLFLSRQLGHSKPEITLRLYGDLFALEEQGNRLRATLDEVMPTG